MANKKISQLDAAGTLTGVELVPVVQDAETVRTTVNAIKDFALAGLTPASITLLATEGAGAVLICKAQYRGNSTTFDVQGIPGMQADSTSSIGVGTIVPSGSKGQALQRLVGTSGAVASQGVDFYTTGCSFYRSVSGTGSGGFSLDAMVMIEALTDTQCAFFGVADAVNAMFNLVSEPSALTNFIGIGKDSTDSALQFMSRASGTVTKVALTGVLVSALVNHLLRVQLDVTETDVTYTLTDFETGAIIASGTSTTNLPAEDTKMQVHLAVQTKSSGGATDAKLGFLKVAVTLTP